MVWIGTMFGCVNRASTFAFFVKRGSPPPSLMLLTFTATCAHPFHPTNSFLWDGCELGTISGP